MKSLRPIPVAILLSGCLVAGPLVGAVAAEGETSVPSAPTRWTELSDAPWGSMKDGVWLFGAGVTQDGSVSVLGGRPFGDPTVWTTGDGTTWDDTTPPGLRGVIAYIASTPRGLSILATQDGQTLLHSSSRDGTSWTKPAKMKNTRIAGGELMGEPVYWAGSTGKATRPTPAIWRSPELGTYERLSLQDMRNRGNALDVAALPSEELLVVTVAANGAKPRLHRGTWAGEWEAVSLPATSADGSGRPTLASTSEGVVFADATEDATLWFTTDGSAWEPVAEAGAFTSLIETPDAVWVLPQMLRSSDGRQWCSVGRPGSDSDTLTGLAPLPDGRLLAVGFAIETNKKGTMTDVRPMGWVTDEVTCEPLAAVDIDPVPIGPIAGASPEDATGPVDLPACPMPTLTFPATGASAGAATASSSSEAGAEACEPVLADVSVLIAGPHPRMATIDDTILDRLGIYEEMWGQRCGDKPEARPAKGFGRPLEPRSGWPSVLSKGDIRLDRETGCLSIVATAWHAYRTMDPADAQLEDLAAAAAVYGEAVRKTGTSGKRYIDSALRRYDRDQTKKARKVKIRHSLKELLRERPARPAPSRLHRLVHDAYAANLSQLVPPTHRGFASTEPFTYDQYSNRGVSPLPAACRHGPVYHGCDAAIANAWLAYTKTGDERWYQLASGLRGLILTSPYRNTSAYADSRVNCYLKKNPRQC